MFDGLAEGSNRLLRLINGCEEENKIRECHRGCRGGPNCHHCTWDSLHICVLGVQAKYIKGHRGQYRGDIDGAIDDFVSTLKVVARRLEGVREADARS